MKKLTILISFIFFTLSSFAQRIEEVKPRNIGIVPNNVSTEIRGLSLSYFSPMPWKENVDLKVKGVSLDVGFPGALLFFYNLPSVFFCIIQ